VPRSARLTAAAVLVGVLSTMLPLVIASPASAARTKSIKIADASIVEGDAGQKSLTFSLTWTGAKGGGAVSVGYATADGTAVAGSDYTAKSGTASFNNGCRCATVTVSILGDNVQEGTEAFALNLSSPVNATIADAQAVGTIYDNEGPPAFVVTDAAADENAGTMSFSVLMTNGSASTQTVDVATADGTAVAGSDYTASSGTLTFTTGQTSKTVTVTIGDDAVNEADETFTVGLTNGTIAIADTSATGTITNDDPEPSVTVADVAVAENGATLEFTIATSAISGQEVDVDYSTTDVTATAGGDYTATSGTAIIPAGSTGATVDVPLSDDSTYEGDETFTIDLSAPYNASIADAQAIGTITEDDAQPSASIGDASVAEGSSGTATAAFTVTLSNPSAFTTSAAWATADGTAFAGSDYTAASGTVTFAPGETTAQVDVDALGDAAVEPDETFTVTLSGPNGLTLGTASGTGTIVDDDRTPTAVTVKVIATRTKAGAKGILESATADAQVTVTLLKKKHTVWVQLAARTVTVTKLGDRDHDGKPDAAYRATFKRPAKGTYKLTTTFGGNATLLACTKSATFKL
jgi:chitinase